MQVRKVDAWLGSRGGGNDELSHVKLGQNDGRLEAVLVLSSVLGE